MLRRLKPQPLQHLEKVLCGLISRRDRFRKNLQDASIEYRDDRDEVADFHSLSHTVATWHTIDGTAEHVVIKVMRHASLQETNGYTDPSKLETSSAVHHLPSVFKFGSQIASHFLVPERPLESTPVPMSENASSTLVVEGEASGPALSRQVPEWEWLLR